MPGPSPDGLSYLLDDSPNSFALTPGFLTPYPNGFLPLAATILLLVRRMPIASAVIMVTIAFSAVAIPIPC